MDQEPHRWVRLWARFRYLFTLTALELRFVVCAAKGEEFDCALNGGRTGDEIDKIRDWERRKIRAGVIVALCAGEVPGLSVHPRGGLRLRGAYVVGRVDLSRAQLSQCPLDFHTCRFEQPVSLYQATTADVGFTSCILPGLLGDDLNSSGSLALRKTQVEGEVRLRYAQISGPLDCDDAHLSNPGGDALYASSLNAADVYIRNNAHVEGRVRLRGAKISGDLNCDGAHLSNPGGDALSAGDLNAGSVFLRDAEVEGEVDLLYAQISTTLECDKAHLSNPGGAALDAESLNAADVYIRNNAHVEGEVRLLYAKISGELDCRKAHLSNPGGIALFADSLNAAQVSLADHTHVEGEVRLLNAQISDQLNCRNAHLSNPGGGALYAEGLNAGHVLLRRAQVEGEVSLLRAQISGMLNCNDAHLSNPGGDALDADGLNAADVFLRGAKVEGEVRLLDAQLSGGLECDGAYLSNPGEVALNADRLNATSAFLRTNAKFAGDVRLNGAKISGQLHLGDAQVEGEVNLRGAKINGTLWCDGAHLDNSDGYVLFGPDCRVGGTFLFRLAKPAVGKIDLSSAQVVGPLVDNLASWPTTLNLRDFSYRSLGGDDTDPSQRLEWLGRSEPFSPDVYTQLAEVYRRSGEEGHAREVAIERERERTKQPDLSPWVRAWRRFFGCTVAYGYKPWRALVGLILSFFFGWFWFALPPAQNVMVHAPHNIKGPKHATDCHKDYPCFSPPVYTLDTLLPIVDLHQESNWEPASERQWGLGYEILTWGLIAVGWILTTAVVASIGSLWRRE